MINDFAIGSISERLDEFKKATRPYGFKDNVKVLLEQARQTWHDVSDLESKACPDNMAQASITMQPSFVSRTFFPEEFLNVMQLQCVGVRQVQCFPRMPSEDAGDDGEMTISIIVVGKRQDFQSIPSKLEKIAEDTLVAMQIQCIESMESVTIYDKVDLANDYFDNVYLVGLYVTPGKTVEESRADFVRYAVAEGFEVHPTFLANKGDLFYLLIKGERYKMDAIGNYCFTFCVRVPPKSS